MNSLKGIFDTQKPQKRNFILENMKQLRTMRKPSDNNNFHKDTHRKKLDLYPHVTAKVSTHFSSNSLLSSKGSSSVERADHGKKNNSPNLTSTGMLNIQHEGTRSQHSNTNGSFKSSAAPKSQDDCGSISNIYKRETHGKNKSNIFDMTTDISPMSHTRSASIVHGSTSHIPQENKLPCVVSENQSYTLPVRSLGCQTVPSDDIDRMLNEGVIKYPSTWNMESLISHQKTVKKSKRPTTCDSGLQTEISAEISTPNMCQNSASPKRILPSNEKVSVCQHSQKFFHPDLEKENSKEQINAKIRMVSDKNFSQGHWYGGLRSRKCEDHGVSQNAFTGLQENVEGDSSTTCPIGNVPLPETERVETLKVLHRSYEEHIKELNLLPVRTDTLKMRQRKIDLERQLNKLEEGIKVFSRPKVYMKMGYSS